MVGKMWKQANPHEEMDNTCLSLGRKEMMYSESLCVEILARWLQMIHLLRRPTVATILRA